MASPLRVSDMVRPVVISRDDAGMPPGQLLLLTGSPGCGKTTIAPLVADRAPLSVCLDLDWFFGKLRSGALEPWRGEAHQQNRVVLSAAASAVATFTAGGYFTVADGILYPFMLDLFVDACKPLGIDLNYAVLRARHSRWCSPACRRAGPSHSTPAPSRTRRWSRTSGGCSRRTDSKPVTASTWPSAHPKRLPRRSTARAPMADSSSDPARGPTDDGWTVRSTDGIDGIDGIGGRIEGQILEEAQEPVPMSQDPPGHRGHAAGK